MGTTRKSDDKSEQVRKGFKDLPIDQKISMLVDLEILTVAEGLEKLGECSISLANKIFDTVLTSRPQQTNSETQPKSE